MARTCRLDGCSDPVHADGGTARQITPMRPSSPARHSTGSSTARNTTRLGQFRAEGQSAKYDDQQAVVDLTLPGAASRPPNYDVPTWPAAASSARELAGRPFWLSLPSHSRVGSLRNLSSSFEF